MAIVYKHRLEWAAYKMSDRLRFMLKWDNTIRFHIDYSYRKACWFNCYPVSIHPETFEIIKERMLTDYKKQKRLAPDSTAKGEFLLNMEPITLDW